MFVVVLYYINSEMFRNLFFLLFGIRSDYKRDFCEIWKLDDKVVIIMF